MTSRFARTFFRLGLVLALLGHISCQDSYVVTRGNVTIAAMTGVNKADKGKCGAYNAGSLQEVLALTWFVDALNEMNYVDGVKIGLEVHRTCGLPAKASRAAMDLLKKCDSGNSPPLLGIVGPRRTSEAMAVSSLVSSLPSSQHVLQISGGATGRQLSDKTRFPNFFRVIPPDDIQVQVMLKLMLEMKWNYVAIVYDNDDYGRPAATQLRALALENDICVPVFASLPLEVASIEFNSAGKNIVGQIKNSEGSVVRGMIIIGGPDTTTHLLDMLEDQTAFVQLIISEAVRLRTSTFFSQEVALGSLVTSPPDIPVTEFTSFWNDLWTNETLFNAMSARLPWLRGYLDKIAICSMATEAGGTDCWDQSQVVRDAQKIPLVKDGGIRTNLFLGYTIKAMAVVVEVLRLLREEKCGGSSQGACKIVMDTVTSKADVLNALRPTSASPSASSSSSAVSFSFTRFANVSQALGEMSAVTFDDNGEVSKTSNSGSEYCAYNLREGAYFQIGTFSSDQQHLNLDKSSVRFYGIKDTILKWSQLPPAQCDDNHNCPECEPDVSESVVFIPGNFHLLAIVPVHAKNPKDLLQCGVVKGVVGADMAEAVIFAIKEANKKEGQFRNILPGSDIGVVIISSCGSKLLVRQRLMAFFSGRLVLPDGRTSSVLLNSTVAVVGAFYSGNSIAASDTLTSLEQPFVQVSPASTNPDLKDRTRHPYFMRLVPPDDKQAQVLLDIVHRLGANYIQVIYDGSTSYASGLFLKLQEAVGEPTSVYHNVCIAQSIATKPHKEVSKYKYIASKLRDRSAARIVVIVLHAEEISKVMEAILPLLGPEDNFLFLASESWGRRQQIIDGHTSLVGSLVLTQEIAINQIFARYLADLDPSAPSSHNPWLRFFWEARLDCFFPNSFERRGRTQCSDDLADTFYIQDTRVPFYIQSVYALVKGLNEALTKHCGKRARVVCSNVTSTRLVAAMKTVKLDLYSTGQAIPVFDDNGDGLVGFKVLRIDLDDSGTNVKYSEVGRWNSDGLILKKSDVKPVSSVCPNSAECDACFSNRGRPERRGDETANTEDGEKLMPVTVTAGIASGLGIVIIILCLVIVCLVRRQKVLTDAADLNRRQRQQQHQLAELRAGDEDQRFDREFNQYSVPDLTSWDRGRMPLPRPTPCHKRPAADYLTPFEVSSSPSVMTSAMTSTMTSSSSMNSVTTEAF